MVLYTFALLAHLQTCTYCSLMAFSDDDDDDEDDDEDEANADDPVCSVLDSQRFIWVENCFDKCLLSLTGR